MTDSDYPRPHLKGLSGKNRPVTTANVILGIFAAVLLFLLAVMVLPVEGHTKQAAKRTQCLSNTKQMVLALLAYATDNDERFPPATGWMDNIHMQAPAGDMSSSVLNMHDPGLEDRQAYGYALRKKAGGVKVASIAKPESFVLVFDSELLGRSAFGELGTMPGPGRHAGKDTVGFVDGHVKTLTVNSTGDIQAPSYSKDKAVIQ